MQSNLSVNNVNPVFGARVSKNFIKAAHNYLNGVEYNGQKCRNFDRKVTKVENNFDNDDYTIIHKKIRNGKNTEHALYAINENYDPILITKKDKFRKVIEKFMHLSKQELDAKIVDALYEQYKIKNNSIGQIYG